MSFRTLAVLQIMSMLGSWHAQTELPYRGSGSFGFSLYGYISNCPPVAPKPKPKNVLRVMIIDTGTDGTRPELAKYIPKRYQDTEHTIDPNGHGTHVAGIIAAKACKGVELLPCRYYSTTIGGVTNLENELKCIDMAIGERADVINFSSGGYDAAVKEKEKVDTFLHLSSHQYFFSAAGNEGYELKDHPYYPCSYRLTDHQTCVGSTDKEGKPLYSSNKAPWIVWELGLNVESLAPGGGKAFMSGTSQATAIQTSKYVEAWCSKHRSKK